MMIPSSSHAYKPAHASAMQSAAHESTPLEQAIKSENLNMVRQHFNTPGTKTSEEEVRGALDLAIRHNDVGLGDLILRKYRSPAWGASQNISEEMRTLRIYVHRKHALYPSGMSSNGKYTDLDHALWNHERDRAAQILNDKWPNSNTGEIWAAAITSGELDVLRALLVLQLADNDRDFRRLENSGDSFKVKIRDEPLRRVLKEVPHYSPKRDLKNTHSHDMAGRRLVQHWMQCRAAAPGAKFDYAHIRDDDTIRQHVGVSGIDIHNMKRLALEVHLINNRKLGEFIARQFDAMLQAGQTRVHVLMESVCHDGMGMELMIKTGTDEQRKYVVKFFNPDMATTHVRSASSSPQYFESLDVRSFLDTPAALGTLLSNGGISLMYVRPSDEVLRNHAGRPVKLEAGRRLAAPLEDAEIDGTTIWHLLEGGFDGNLHDIEDFIKSRPEDERAMLLSTTHGAGPGLFLAMHDGHEHAAAVFFAKLLPHVPDIEQRISLLSAKHVNGTPGLHMAYFNGDAGIMRAFPEALAHVPDKERRTALLAAKRADNVPGLYFALGRGNAALIKELDAPFSMVSEADRAALLEARDFKNIPGIFWALQRGHAAAVEAFAELAKKVLSSEQFNILLIRLFDATVVTLFMEAIRANNDNTLLSFGKLLPQMAPNDRAQLLGALLPKIPESSHSIALLASMNDDNPADLFRSALENDNSLLITAFGALIPILPDEDQARVLADEDICIALTNSMREGLTEAVTAYAGFGPMIALRHGHIATAEALGTLLNHLPYSPPLMTAEALNPLLRQMPHVPRYTRLLIGMPIENVVGLFSNALDDGKTDTIRAFGKLLPYLPHEYLAGFLNATGSSNAISSAMQANPSPACMAYAEFGVSLALQHGHIALAGALAAVARHIPDEEQRNRLLDATCVGAARIFLADALQNGNRNAIRDFGNFFLQLPVEYQARLLEDAARGPLRLALMDGHLDTVEEFSGLLHQIHDADLRARLLAAICDDTTSKLFRNALTHGATNTIQAFRGLIRHLTAEQQVNLLTEAAREALRPALQAGHVEAIRAFARTSNLVAQNLSPVQRRSLLNAYRASHTERVLGIRGTRRNERNYEELKTANPAFYAEFKAMKEAVK